MNHIAYIIGYSIGTLVHVIVGARLIALSVRSGQTTDRLLSVSFLFWIFSYLLYGIPWLIHGNEELIPHPLVLASMVSLYPATITFTIFTRMTFGGRGRTATWLAGAAIGCLIVGVAGSFRVGDWGGELPLSNPWWWFTRVGFAAPYFWMAAGGIAQYVKARRRVQLGLCTPRVCNRYLLWGVAGGLWLLLELVESAEYIVYESTGMWSETLPVFTGLLEAVPGLIICLVFFPPALYRNWIDSRTPAAHQGGAGAA